MDNAPSMLLFGVKQKLHAKNDLEKFMEDLNFNQDRDLEAIRNEADAKIREVQQYNKEKHDAKCKRNTVYSEGDLVAIRAVKVPGVNSKLKPKFRGPYRIQKVLDNNRYIISDLDGYQVTSTHFDGTFDPLNLRLYKKGVVRETESDSYDSCSEDEFYGFPEEPKFYGFPREKSILS